MMMPRGLFAMKISNESCRWLIDSGRHSCNERPRTTGKVRMKNAWIERYLLSLLRILADLQPRELNFTVFRIIEFLLLSSMPIWWLNFIFPIFYFVDLVNCNFMLEIRRHVERKLCNLINSWNNFQEKLENMNVMNGE